MRIVAGAWRGRTLIVPPGQATRPTADRVRQALFDMLMHAEWGGRSVIDGAVVLDVFAGTGALGLEALSRGAASACFIESDGTALQALRTNIAACKAGDRTTILAVDVLAAFSGPNSCNQQTTSTSFDPRHGSWRDLSGRRAATGGRDRSNHAQREHATTPATLVFLDPPYGKDFVPRALAHLRDVGRINAHALIIAETGRDETWVPDQPLLAERQHGAARILVFRAT